MAGKISTCQSKLIALLYADPFFTDLTDPDNPVVKVPIIFKKLGDVNSLLDEQLANIGVGLVVIMRHARRPEKNTYELRFVCQFALSAVENPIAKDASAPDAYDIAEKAAVILNGKMNGVTAGDDSDEARFWVDDSALGPLPTTKDKAFLDVQLLLVNTTIDLSP